MLFSSSTQSLVQVDDSLHLVERVAYFRQLCAEVALLGRQYFKVG